MYHLKQKNRWGEESHPSDCLVHWSEKYDSSDFESRRRELIAAWDLVHLTPELCKATEIIMDWTRELALNDAKESFYCEA